MVCGCACALTQSVMLRQEANIVVSSHGAQHCSHIAPLHGHSKSLSQVVVRLELSSLHLQTVPKFSDE